MGHTCGSIPVFPALLVSLKKNETILSFLHYLRSRRNRVYKSDAPSSDPSEEKAHRLPSIPNGRLTGLRSFMQKAHLTRPSPKQTTLRSASRSEYDDLECGEWELENYHTHLKQANAAGTATQWSCIGGEVKT